MKNKVTMLEKSKKQKTNFVSEEDISTLLQRYTATTVLALLQEVARVQEVKIDWNELVKTTTTGISNAREYQMLWRHLAYRLALSDGIHDSARPMDDDSDLECELEAFPAVSSEASAEAAACVKVLIASGASNNPKGSTVEAPLTINIPKGQMSKALKNSHFTTNTQGRNITVPISVQKQPLPTNTNAETLDSNGAANANLPRRKRKLWSDAEDMELVAAVKKCGEGNWANMLKGDFKGNRTPQQLSQRWAIIRKQHGNGNVGTGSQLSEAQLAARAVSLALNMPMGGNLKTSCSIASAGVNSNSAHSKLGQTGGNETPGRVAQSLPQAQRDSVPTAVPSGSSKTRMTTMKPLAKSTLNPDSMVKAAAVAAGARIATPSDAASLSKAAQSKNAVHIMPGGSLIKSSTSGNTNSLPSNVHFIRTGLASKPHSSYSNFTVNTSQPAGTQLVQGHCTKHAAPVIRSHPAICGSDLSALSDVKNASLSISISRADVKGAEDDDATFGNSRKELVEEDQAGFACKALTEEMEIDKNSFSGSAPVDRDAGRSSCEDQVRGGQSSEVETKKEQVKGNEVSASANVPIKQVRENQIDSASSGLAADNDDLGQMGGNHSACEENHVNEGKEGLASMVDGK